MPTALHTDIVMCRVSHDKKYIRSNRLGTKVAAGSGHGGVFRGQHTRILLEDEKARGINADEHENIRRAQVDMHLH